MTEPPLHPQRCDTCTYFSYQGFPRCEKLRYRIVPNEEYIINHLGCATHSSAQSERNNVLEEAIEHYKQEIESGKGVTYNHPITYQWMYGGVIKYLESLRKP